MHDNRIINLMRVLWLTAMVSVAVSCHKELIYPQTGSAPTTKPSSEVTVKFNILDPDAAPRTKASAEDGYASDAEKTINNIYLFVMDYDAESGLETLEESVKIDLKPEDFTSEGVSTGYTFKLSSGTKHFYAGANMTEEHACAFINNMTMKADTYEAALAMVMNDYDTNGNGSNILMLSGAATEDPGVETDIDITGKSVIYVKASLERLVAKVMTAAVYNGSVANPSGRNGETVQYISTSEGFFFDFQFILFNTNKKLNVAKTFEGSQAFNADPNWKLSTMVESSNGSIHYKNLWDCNGNFSFWDDEGIKERLDASNWWSLLVPKYDKSLSLGEQKFLGQGLYCLENTVYDDLSEAAGLTAEEKNKAAYLATTHVYIRARFAPIEVYGAYNPGRPQGSQDVRIGHMYYSNDRSGKNPYTFYVQNNSDPKKFYTTEGIENWADSNYADFTEYTGGWVYFKTFFEGDRDNDGKLVHNSKSWGISRNDYCILTIETMKTWGNNTPGDAFIKVKSQTVPWNLRGRAEIEVTPE